MMDYEILDVDALGRIGFFEIRKTRIVTPTLIPVIHPFDNIIKPSFIKRIGFDLIFTNSYIIYQNKVKRNEVIEKGLHDYLNFNGLIATDSGAFQMYMYQNNDFNLDPQSIETFQEKIKSDFPVILDLPVQLDDDYNTAKTKIHKTVERSKENIRRRTQDTCHWIGPIHGGRYRDLLRTSAKEMSKLDFDIYALGGLVKAFLDYRFKDTIEMLMEVKKNIIPNKPLHMFGLGLPQFFSLAVACGCDLMDSAAYILYAEKNRYFDLSTGTKNLEEMTEFPCNCPICLNYTPKEIMKFSQEERTKLLAKHNLYISQLELKTIRQAIRDGNLWELVEQRVRNHPNLVDALSESKNHLNFFEEYEKTYKDHGRLFSSLESLNRPLNFRYKKNIISKFRIPSRSRYLIILPELDVRIQNSPSLQIWVSKLNNQRFIRRENIHLTFFSPVFGIIPLALQNSYPVGQYESLSYNFLEHNNNRCDISNIIN
ncbi:MAG: tRNA guanosine(15) transglycosylase TgtA [Candidatus Lokiarchaeota archaeon]